MTDRIDLGRLKLGWDDGRTERLLSEVNTKIVRRVRIRRTVFASASLASVALVLAVWFSFRAPSVSSSFSSSVIQLAEGSEIRVDGRTAEVRVVEEQPSRVRVEAVRGRAAYEVVPRPGRTFEVHAGAVVIQVVGTAFVVEPRGDKAWVEVSRGKVDVSWNGGREHAFVAAGESGLFPRPPLATAADADADADADATAPPAVAAPSATSVAAPSLDSSHASSSASSRADVGHRGHRDYRARVDRRDYRAAYALLSQHPALAGDTVEELLVATDVARLSKHPAQAVPYLERILREHARDERAHQAAFTLGRTLMGLGRTKDAMNMFGRVRRDWPGNPLAEDALVRQAQAAVALGDRSTARRLAEEYARAYPHGKRGSEVLLDVAGR